MPSDRETTTDRTLELLRSQGLGVACGVATVLLLAIGSFVLSWTGDGASAGVRMDEIRAFLAEPSPWHFWFYALVPVLALYAVNTLLATLHNVQTKWRAGVRSPFRYGPAVLHVSFAVALLAHMIGGLWSAERGTVLADGAWSPVGDGREIRLVDLDVDSYPNGQPRGVRARVELRAADGAVETRVAAFNAPISDGWGSRLLLVSRWGNTPPTVRFTLGANDCRAAIGEGCALGAHKLMLKEIRTLPDGQTKLPVILLAGGGRSPHTVMVAPHGGVATAEGPLTATYVPPGPAVLFRYRYAPGDPWALAASLLLAAGVVLLGRRWTH